MFTYEQVFAADPANPANIAQNASITIFAPGDATMAPLTITDPDGSPLPNPIPVNANGFGSAFAHATLDRVAWAGGGFTGFFTSYEGMKQVALDAQAAAETAATTAGAQATIRLDELIAAGNFEGPAGPLTNLTVGTVEATPGNPLTDEIVASEVTAGTLTTAALNATNAREVATSATGNDAVALQAKINAAAASGKPVALRKDAVYVVSATITVPSGVIIEGNGATIKAAPGLNANVITNADRVGGNTEIIIRDLKVDGNLANQTADFTVAEFQNVTHCRFWNLDVQGGRRKTGFPNGTHGDGLRLIQSHYNEIVGGRFHHNEYDGIKISTSTYNTITAVHCDDNGRSGIQLSTFSPTGPPYNAFEGVDAWGANNNIIVSPVITHSTGTPGPAAPTTSGIYLHTASRNTVSNVQITGTQQGIGFFAASGDNQFNGGLIRHRHGTTDRAGLDLESGTEYRNTFTNIAVRGYSGADGRLYRIAQGGTDNRFINCTFEQADGTGTWLQTNLGTRTLFSSPSSPATRAEHFTGASGAVPFGWATRWNQAGVTSWAEDAAGYLRLTKTAGGRSALAYASAGDLDTVEVLTKVRMGSAAEGNTYLGTVLRGSGASGAESGYNVGFIYASGAPQLQAYRYGTGAGSVALTPFTWAANTWYWLRVRISNGSGVVVIRAKAWADGSNEPNPWNISANDGDANRITTPGFIGLLGFSAGTMDADQFTYAVGHSSASTV